MDYTLKFYQNDSLYWSEHVQWSPMQGGTEY
jgi:hypothetical protein